MNNNKGDKKSGKTKKWFRIMLILTAAAVTTFAASCGGNKDQSDNTEETAEISVEETAEPEEEQEEEETGDIEEDTSWKQVYIDYINSLTETEDGISEHEYSLIYVDNDDIPELYVMCTYMAEGDRICTVVDGAIEELVLNRSGGSSYIEREGLISDFNGNNGIITLDIYSLEDGIFTTLYDDIGIYELVMDEESADYVDSYSWDGSEVTEDEFYANWDEIFNTAAAKEPWEETCLADEMIEMLGGGEEASADEDVISISAEGSTIATYAEEVLVPAVGSVAAGDYTGKYANDEYGSTVRVDPEISDGVLTSSIRDFDGDGTDELLVLMLKNVADVDGEETTYHAVYLQMYEEENGSVVLADEYEALCPVLGGGDKESSGVFLKESSGQIYICGSEYHDWGVISDGITYNSFVVTYTGSAFAEDVSTDGTISGSDFYDEGNYERESGEMADFLEQIGLTGEAAQIRSTLIRKFDFVDDVELLMRVTGEPTGDEDTYYMTMNAADLGSPVYSLELEFN